MGAAMGAAAAFEFRLQLPEASLAHERHQVARVEALAMAAIKTEHPKQPLRPADIRQCLDRPNAASEQIMNMPSASRAECRGEGISQET